MTSKADCNSVFIYGSDENAFRVSFSRLANGVRGDRHRQRKPQRRVTKTGIAGRSVAVTQAGLRGFQSVTRASDAVLHVEGEAAVQVGCRALPPELRRSLFGRRPNRRRRRRHRLGIFAKHGRIIEAALKILRTLRVGVIAASHSVLNGRRFVLEDAQEDFRCDGADR